MKLTSVRLINFRGYQKEFTLPVDALTVIIGKNEAGKSTIFDALNIFFGEAKIDKDDASISGDKSNVVIACEFDDLPSAVVIDEDAETSLESEYLLKENKRFEVVKTYNCALASPKLSNVKIKAKHPTSEPYHNLHSLNYTKLKQLAEKELPPNALKDIDNRKNNEIRKALWQQVVESNLNLKEVEIVLDDNRQKAIDKLLPLYALFKSDRTSTDQDNEAQDPMKLAVQEALKQVEKDLKQIQDYVHKQVQEIASLTLQKLGDMDQELAKQLTPRFEEPNWKNIFKISLTGDNDVPINKRGSGVRRLILLNFFRAKVEQQKKIKNNHQVILAIEEPETSQHPNNQRMLMDAFLELAESNEYQIMISTHTPVLAQMAPVKYLRYIQVDKTNERILYFHQPSPADQDIPSIIKLASDALGVLPDLNVRLFVCVEGPHDIEFLRRISKRLHDEDVALSNEQRVPDLGALEDEGRIIFIILGGSVLKYWVARLAQLNIPEFYLLDRDTPKAQEAHYQEFADKINREQAPRCKAIITGKRELENYLHLDAINDALEGCGKKLNKPQSNWDELNIPGFLQLPKEAKQKYNLENLNDSEKHFLNKYAVEKMNYKRLADVDKSRELISWIEQMVEMGKLP